MVWSRFVRLPICNCSGTWRAGASSFWTEIATLLRVMLILPAVFQCAAVAQASDARTEKMLKQLDPDARFEQVCDLEAMRQISRDKTYKPERSIVGALEIPKVVEFEDERRRRWLPQQRQVVSVLCSRARPPPTT